MVNKGNHPQIAKNLRLVKYYNLPIYICIHIIYPSIASLGKPIASQSELFFASQGQLFTGERAGAKEEVPWGFSARVVTIQHFYRFLA